MWFDGFAVPWLAEVLPQVFTAPKTLSLQIGGLLSYVLFPLGWVLYGLAALRARAIPVGLSLALVVGGVLGYHSGLPPYGTPIGLAVAALGCWLIHRDRRPPVHERRSGVPERRTRVRRRRTRMRRRRTRVEGRAGVGESCAEVHECCVPVRPSVRGWAAPR
jgi:hypothetical protein